VGVASRRLNRLGADVATMLQVPLFPGVPGGPELIIIFLVILLVFGPVVLGVVVLFAYLRRKGGGDDEKDERIAELEARIDELEGETGGDATDRHADADRHLGADRRASEED
jgi:sec-independent protein translocase protein TatA